MRTIHIIIADTKSSSRFPGKNKLLWEYTMDYLALQAPELAEEHQVNIHILGSELTQPIKVRSIDGCNVMVRTVPNDFSQDITHVLLWWYKNVLPQPGDINIQLQLTQPLRRPKLLKDTVDKVIETNAPLVKSYVEWQNDSWRNVEGDLKRTCDTVRLYDGAIYAWTGFPDWIAAHPAGSVYVKNYTGPVVDIDYPWQYNRDYIEGVRRLASNNKDWY